jgi:hypothetical protein
VAPLLSVAAYFGGMTAAADRHPCPGIRILRLEFDRDNALIVLLTEPLGCPACDRVGQRWVIPVNQDRIFHRPDPP